MFTLVMCMCVSVRARGHMNAVPVEGRTEFHDIREARVTEGCELP